MDAIKIGKLRLPLTWLGTILLIPFTLIIWVIDATISYPIIGLCVLVNSIIAKIKEKKNK